MQFQNRPKSTREVISELRAQGYQVSVVYIQSLLMGGSFIPPEKCGKSFIWFESDIARLLHALRRRGRFTAPAVKQGAGT